MAVFGGKKEEPKPAFVRKSTQKDEVKPKVEPPKKEEPKAEPIKE